LAARFVVRYELSVRPADVGSRVALRLRLPEGGMTDVLGVLEDWDAGVLRVRRRDGTVTEVPAEALVAGKLIPPAPVRRTHADVSPRDLEEIAALGWRALETSRLGGWLLRASGGWTGRANSVLPLDDPGLPLDEAVVRVEQWYEVRGLTPRFQVPMPLCARLDAYLAERGWSTPEDVLVMTADIAAVLPLLPARDDLPAVALSDEPSAGWLATYRYRGGPLPDNAVAVLVNADQPVFASVELEGATAAVARASVDRRWMGVTAVDVAESARRRGLARHVMRALLSYAARAGARHLYLQVSEHNAPAIALYEGMGLTVHHTYRYRLAR
jgi:ribosomal protein S18 acetylase RimI-like enzyme